VIDFSIIILQVRQEVQHMDVLKTRLHI